MSERLFLPCLRGAIGDWVYYASIMKLEDIAARINYAEVIHPSEKLSGLIQRELDKGRGRKIRDYLVNTKERFFNSILVAVYKGDPEWYDIGKISTKGKKQTEIAKMPDNVIESIGILSFSGTEKLYALDGQHRLAGIKLAIVDKPELRNEEVSVLFVAHHETKAGKQRSRRLFTVLNKTARPVTKGGIIALDEDDVMAINTRRLIEENSYFNNDMIVFNATNNIPVNNKKCLTTIGNLYDILSILYKKVLFNKQDSDLKFYRPDDDTLEKYYVDACSFFELLISNFTPLKEYTSSNKKEKIVSKYRTKNGGNILFRPVGLTIIVDVISRLTKKYTWQEAIDIVSKLPQTLEELPFNGVLWNPYKKTMNLKGKSLAIRLMLYMLGEKSNLKKLREDYAKALDVDINAITLPPQQKKI